MKADLLSKLPKNTPVWAAGIVSLIVALTVSFSVVYSYARPEIKDYMGNVFSLKGKTLDAENSVINSILQIAASNTKQITILSETNQALTNRVALIERDLDSTKMRLTLCEKSLNSCKKDSRT